MIYMYLHASTSVCVKMHNHVMQGCRQGGRDWGEFKLMLLCVQAVTAKGRPNFIVENKRGNNSFQVMLHQRLEVSKYMNSLSLYATNSILGAKPPPTCCLCPCHVHVYVVHEQPRYVICKVTYCTYACTLYCL